MKKLKVALCLPWYAGPDRDCTAQMLTLFNYFGKLQERMGFLAQLGRHEAEWWLGKLPKLDPHDKNGSEIPESLIGTEIEFGLVDEMGCSLIGLARDRCADDALGWGADYLFWFDSDMLVPTSALLRLLANDVPVCGALAFTGRDPITPVIYNAEEKFVEDPERPGEGRITCDFSPVTNYKRDALQKVDAIGSGVMLIKADVFRQIKRPWFYATGIGEDIYFCLMCKRYGIPVYVDTRVKTAHRVTFPDFQTEQKYLQRGDVKLPEAV